MGPREICGGYFYMDGWFEIIVGKSRVEERCAATASATPGSLNC